MKIGCIDVADIEMAIALPIAPTVGMGAYLFVSRSRARGGIGRTAYQEPRYMIHSSDRVHSNRPPRGTGFTYHRNTI